MCGRVLRQVRSWMRTLDSDLETPHDPSPATDSGRSWRPDSARHRHAWPMPPSRKLGALGTRRMRSHETSKERNSRSSSEGEKTDVPNMRDNRGPRERRTAAPALSPPCCNRLEPLSPVPTLAVDPRHRTCCRVWMRVRPVRPLTSTAANADAKPWLNLKAVFLQAVATEDQPDLGELGLERCPAHNGSNPAVQAGRSNSASERNGLHQRARGAWMRPREQR
jgi:hypothetical protein